MNFEEIDSNKVLNWSYLITEEITNEFASVASDKNPIHFSDEYARGLGFNSKIFHGAALISIISGLISREFIGEGSIILKVNSKFMKPAYVGEEVTFRLEVDKKNRLNKTINILFFVINSSKKNIAKGSFLIHLKE